MATPSPSTLTLLALLPLIGWRMYARVRRMIGRQRLSRVRPWITLVVFPLLLGLLALSAHAQPHKLVWLALGLVLGGALGVFGLKRTRFEPTPEGLFYTPDARLAIGLSILFIGRITWRLIQLAVSGPVPPDQGTQFALSPFTLGPVGLFAGYYIAYAIGLVRWRMRVLRARAARGPAP
jgi:hypothetical protein